MTRSLPSSLAVREGLVTFVAEQNEGLHFKVLDSAGGGGVELGAVAGQSLEGVGVAVEGHVVLRRHAVLLEEGEFGEEGHGTCAG